MSTPDASTAINPFVAAGQQAGAEVKKVAREELGLTEAEEELKRQRRRAGKEAERISREQREAAREASKRAALDRRRRAITSTVGARFSLLTPGASPTGTIGKTVLST